MLLSSSEANLDWWHRQSSGVSATFRRGGENGIVDPRETVCPLVPVHDWFVFSYVYCFSNLPGTNVPFRIVLRWAIDLLCVILKTPKFYLYLYYNFIYLYMGCILSHLLRSTVIWEERCYYIVFQRGLLQHFCHQITIYTCIHNLASTMQ